MSDAIKNVVGCIDGVNRGRLHGWVFDKSYPFRRLTVEMVTDLGSRRIVLADRYRADLHQRGLCDGYCGFSAPVEHFPEHASVRIATRAPYVELGILDLSQRPRVDTAKAVSFRCASYSMQIDRPLGHTHITGWAAALTGRNPRRIIRLRSGNNVLAQQRATLYRSEIAMGDCDGYHGFSFPLPVGSTRPFALEDVASGLVFVLLP